MSNGGNGPTVDGAHAVRRVLAGAPVATVAGEEGVELPVLLDLVERSLAVDAAVASGAGEASSPEPGRRPTISVVVPMFNEEDNVSALLDELLPVLRPIGPFEVIFVDDCSTDGSREAVLAARREEPSVRLVELSRNFGHQSALTAGLDHAGGDAVVMMDADLQDPPSLIPELVARWREGNEVVYAVRRNRKEGPVLRACFFLFYRLQSKVSDIDLPLDSGDFALIDRSVADAVRRLPEANRFLRGLRGWVGFRQVGVPYDRPARLHGETKYTARSLMKLAADGLLSFSSLPLRVASLGGMVTTLVAFAYLMIAAVSLVFLEGIPKGWASTMFVQLLLGGAQLTVIGVVGEYLARTYQETKARPPYVVRAAHGATAEPTPRSAATGRG